MIRCVLLAEKSGLPVDKLPRAYLEQVGKDLRVESRSLGFANLQDFLKSPELEDCIKRKTNKHGEDVYMGIADASTQHIADLVSRQGEKKTKRKAKPKRPERRPFHHSTNWNPPAQRGGSDRYNGSGSRGPVQGRLGGPYNQNNGFRGRSSSPQQRPSWSSRNSRDQVSQGSSRPSPGGSSRFTLNNGAGPLREPRGYQGRSQDGGGGYDRDRQGRSQDNGGYDRGQYGQGQGRPQQVASPPRNNQPQRQNQVKSPPRNQQQVQQQQVQKQQQVQGKEQVQRQTSRGGQAPRGGPGPGGPSQQQQQQANNHKRDLKQYFSRNNLGDVPYKTSAIGTKGKERFMATITVEGTQFKTYPQTYGTEAEAEEAVAQKVVKELGILSGGEGGAMAETNDPSLYAKRVVELIGNRLNGVWSTQIEKQYSDKFNEKLPSLWLEEVESMYMIRVESPIPGSGRYIVFPYTPPSQDNVSSPATVAPNLGMTNGLQRPPPHLQPPSDEYWDVYITFIRSTTQVSLRFIGEEYSEKFEDMSTSMELCYYDMADIPRIKEPEIGRIYAAHVASDWHRVKVVNVHGIQVSCYFLDHGDEDLIPVEDLRELQPKFLELPAQAFSVSLSGLEDYQGDDQVISLLNSELLGKSLIAKVATGENAKLPSLILFDTSGELDVNLNKQLIETLGDGDEGCRLPPVGGEESKVFVSYISSNGDIYVQKESQTFSLIEKIISESGDEVQTKPTVDETSLDSSQLYLAKYSEDDALYRAALLTENIKEGKVRAFFVDYGNEELILVKELWDIPESLADLPKQALKCRLSGVPPEGHSWSQAATAFLRGIVPETQTVSLKVVEGGTQDCPLVELYLPDDSDGPINFDLSTEFDIFPMSLPMKMNGESNNNSTGDSGTATPDIAGVSPLPVIMSDLDLAQLKPLLAPVIPPVGSYYDVTVTLAVSPSNFMVQPYKEGEQLEKLMNQLNNFYNDPAHIREISDENIEEGAYFAARHIDDYWYRVRVTKVIDAEHAAVRYVDYGDLSMVSLRNLQPLCLDFRNLPYQAIHARLADILPTAGDWSPEDTILFNQRVVDQQFVSMVKNVSESSCGELTVDLTLIDTSDPSEDKYIHQMLIDEEIAVSTDPRQVDKVDKEASVTRLSTSSPIPASLSTSSPTLPVVQPESPTNIEEAE